MPMSSLPIWRYIHHLQVTVEADWTFSWIEHMQRDLSLINWMTRVDRPIMNLNHIAGRWRPVDTSRWSFALPVRISLDSFHHWYRRVMGHWPNSFISADSGHSYRQLTPFPFRYHYRVLHLYRERILRTCGNWLSWLYLSCRKPLQHHHHGGRRYRYKLLVDDICGSAMIRLLSI